MKPILSPSIFGRSMLAKMFDWLLPGLLIINWYNLIVAALFVCNGKERGRNQIKATKLIVFSLFQAFRRNCALNCKFDQIIERFFFTPASSVHSHVFIIIIARYGIIPTRFSAALYIIHAFPLISRDSL